MFALRFASPWWLLGLLLVPVIIWQARGSLAGLGEFRRRASLAMRIILVVATVLALAEAYWRQESREVTTIFLVDRSDSLTRADQGRALDYVRAASDRRGADAPGTEDCAGLVLFAGSSSVERAPNETFRVPDQPASVIDAGHTDIAEGLRLAAAAFPAGARKRVVLVSDGLETRGAAAEEARRLVELGVRVDCVPLTRRGGNEVLVERLAVRPEARVGEPVEVRASLRALQPASGTMRLFLGEKLVETRRYSAREAGRLPPEIFTVRLPRPDFYSFELRLEPDPGTDTLPQNNVGYAFTHVPGEARVLVLYSPEGESKKDNPQVDIANLVKSLGSEKIAVKLAGPDAIPVSAAELAQYDCVIIANLGAYAFTAAGMKAVQVAVREMGVGLVMIGGMDSFGAGGYLNTPIEEALPVTCDVRQRKTMPKGALAIIIDCSGSMSGDKLARAKAGAQAAADALSDDDYVAVMSFDTQVNWLVKPVAARERKHVRDGIAKLGSGGGTHIYPALEEAWKALKPLDASVKHIVLLSDGQTTGSGHEELAGKIGADRITITSVGIGEPDGQQLMQEMAKRGGGRFYYVANDWVLPQIFIKEAVTVRRAVVFTEPFTPAWSSYTPPVKGFAGAELPGLGGYVVTTPKARAETPLVVKLKEIEDPILAHWQYGEGRAVAFTSTAAPDWAGKWIAWPGYAPFWAQLVRWTSRASGSEDLQLSAEIRGSAGKLIVEAIDDQGRPLNALDLTGHAVDPRQQGQDFPLVQTAPGRYEASFPAGEPGAYSVAVTYRDARGQMRSQLTGASCNYSPEFAAASEPGTALLEEVARVTGGRMLSGRAEEDRRFIWSRDLPPGYRVHPGWKWLLWLAFVLFPLDVAVRRVMIDWLEVGQKLRALAGRILPQLKPAVAGGPDPTMQALLTEKERIRQAAPPPSGEDVRARFAEQLSRARAELEAEPRPAAEDVSPERRRPANQAAPASVKQDARPKPQAADDRKPAARSAEGVSSYTAALLEAKKRAIKERQQSESREQKPGS